MSGERKGDRVRLLLPMDLDPRTAAVLGKDWEDIEPGTEGTVRGVDDGGTVHVQWDNGRNLGLIPDVDVWMKL